MNRQHCWMIHADRFGYDARSGAHILHGQDVPMRVRTTTYLSKIRQNELRCSKIVCTFACCPQVSNISTPPLVPYQLPSMCVLHTFLVQGLESDVYQPSNFPRGDIASNTR